MLSFSFSGCAQKKTNMVNEKELQSIREKNLQKDIKSLNDKAVVEDVEPTDHIEPVIDGRPLTLEDAVTYAYNIIWMLLSINWSVIFRKKLLLEPN